MAKSHLTAERLRELLHYDQETGAFTWRIPVKGVRPFSAAGAVNKILGYVVIGIDRNRFYAHRLAWLYVHGHWPAHQIDHMNGVRHDNRLANLREATSGENKQNKSTSWSSTGIRGVYTTNRFGIFRASIGINGKQISLGQFNSLDAASQARRDAELKYFTHHLVCEPPGGSLYEVCQRGETVSASPSD